jgi:alkanesulfonate monooxygenase SsuD/methylene tetrahydromethanopterin reductase-like flavin-dependent oxidoreductase (luciferase family)
LGPGQYRKRNHGQRKFFSSKEKQNIANVNNGCVKLGLNLSNQYLREESIAQRIDEVVEQVDLMRQMGFDLFSVGQHHLAAPFQQPDSVALVARLAAAAGDMRVGITVFLLPLHNPVDIAEQVATLDAISHGRMIFGVGLGYRAEECQAYGITLQERVPRFLESLELIKLLWTSDEVSFDGRFYSIPRVQSTIRTVQKPHPPIWMAANQAVAVKRCGALGHTWVMNPHVTVDVLLQQLGVYREALAANGHAMPAELPLLREAWIADSRERAWQEAAPYLARKYAVYTDWGQDRAVPADQTFDRPLEELARERFIIGTPDDLVGAARRYADELGVTTLILRVQWPGMPRQQVLDQIRLIGESVLSRLHETSASLGKRRI